MTLSKRSPLPAPPLEGRAEQGTLELRDSDPYDFAMAERVFPVAKKMQAEFSVTAGQNDHGELQIEMQNEQNLPALRLSFEPDGTLIAKAGARIKKIMSYLPGIVYTVRIGVNTDTRM